MKKNLLHLILLLSSIYCFGQTTYYGSSANVYIAGSYMDGTEQKACYWKNGELIPLNGVIGSTAAITVEDGIVYTAGVVSFIDRFKINRKCVLCWANGQAYGTTESYSDTGVAISDMSVCNGKTYILGVIHRYDRWDKVMWVDGVEQSSDWTSLSAYDGIMYFMNSTGFSAYDQYIRVDGVAYGMTIAYGIVYIAGATGAKSENPCYWIDGERKDIPKYNNRDTYLSDIAVLSNGRVHAIGGQRTNRNSIPVYWGGDRYLSIPNAASFTKIYVYDDKIYLLGRCKRGAISIPCYWVMTEVNGSLNVENMVSLLGAKSASDIVVTK